jgi:dsRNA-specific ribonuclease
MGKGKQVADVSHEEMDTLFSNDKATVTLEDGTVGTGKGLSKSEATAAAATNAGAEADSEDDED